MLEIYLAQVREFQPKMVAIRDASKLEELKEAIKDVPIQPEILVGDEGAIEVARHSEVDAVVTGIVGARFSSTTFTLDPLLFSVFRGAPSEGETLRDGLHYHSKWACLGSNIPWQPCDVGQWTTLSVNHTPAGPVHLCGKHLSAAEHNCRCKECG